MALLRLTVGIVLVAAGLVLAFLWYQDVTGNWLPLMDVLPMKWIDELPGGLLLVVACALLVGRFVAAEAFTALVTSSLFAVSALSFTVIMILDNIADHSFDVPLRVEDLPADPLVIAGIAFGLGLLTYPWSKKERT